MGHQTAPYYPHHNQITEKMESHRLLPNNSNSLLCWDEVFELIQIFYYEPSLSKYMRFVEEASELQHIKDNSTINSTKSISLMRVPYCGIDTIEKRFNDMYSTLGIDDYKQQKEKELYKPDMALYFSFIPAASSHGVHRDVAHIFHWQQLGYSQWTVYDKETHNYVLKPGDCIYVPPGMYHKVVPVTARAGISIGFFPHDYEYNDSELYFVDKEDQYDYNNEYINEVIVPTREERYSKHIHTI